jgi:DNA-binding FrmR family transcriptional regulator
MAQDEQKKLLDRLARVEGQVRGLRKMLEEDRACEDILTQLLAARSGLEQAGRILLERRLDSCLLDNPYLSAETIAELRETMKLWNRYSTAIG